MGHFMRRIKGQNGITKAVIQTVLIISWVAIGHQAMFIYLPAVLYHGTNSELSVSKLRFS